MNTSNVLRQNIGFQPYSSCSEDLYVLKIFYSHTQLASAKLSASIVKAPDDPAGGHSCKTPEFVPNVWDCCPRGDEYVKLKGGEPVKVNCTFWHSPEQIAF